MAWHRKINAAGFTGIHWPVEHGGMGLPPLLAGIFAAEEQHYDVAGNMFSVGVGMAGPTIIEWGTDEQRTELATEIGRLGTDVDSIDETELDRLQQRLDQLCAR